MKKSRLLILTLILTIVVLSIVRTYIANNVATSGIVLSRVETTMKQLQTENTNLAQAVYEKMSYTNLSKEAAGLGFIDSKISFVLNSGVAVAFKQ